MAERDRLIVVSEQELDALRVEASRRCGPHSCGPSRWGWIAAGGVLVYLIVMHSFQMSERAEWRTKYADELNAGAAQSAHDAIAQGEAAQAQEWTVRRQELLGLVTKLAASQAEQFATLSASQAEQFAAMEQGIREARIAQQEARRAQWVYETPALEKEAAVLKRLERLETPR